MLRKGSLLILFFVSYLPLFFILFIENIKLGHRPGVEMTFRAWLSQNVLPLVFLGLSILSVVAYLIIFYYIQRFAFKTPIKVVKVKNTGVEYLSYLGTYIIPFIGMKFDTTNSTVATWVLVLVIAFIYPKTNLVYANPTLALFGFNIYKVNLESDAEEEVVVITRNKIKKNAVVRLRELTDDIFFAKT